MPVYPINFSIHSSKLIENIPSKKRILAPLIPGELNTYIYNNEEEYYKMYQESCFAITKKKAGWDCMRHYEIMANGCLPIFLDIHECPNTILTMLPKQLLIQIHDFYFQHIKGKLSIQDLTSDEYQRIVSYTKEILNYTRNVLTNKVMSQYILHTISPGLRPSDIIPGAGGLVPDAPGLIGDTHLDDGGINNILYLSGSIEADYLRCTILCGFKDIYHKNCHDVPSIKHIYKKYPTPEKCYGKGLSYTLLFPENENRDTSLDFTLLDDIQNHKYDLVIYGSYHRGMPLWGLINRYYKKNEIVLLCGEDTHTCTYSSYSDQGYHVFVRELI